MDPRDRETLVSRLIANPHDEAALNRAHEAGTEDPQSYAALLEQVGQGTPDPAHAAHWFGQAADVWETLEDGAQAKRVLRSALDCDPSNYDLGDRLTQLLRDEGNVAELAQVLERLGDGMAQVLREQPELKPHLIATHEQLAQLYGDEPMAHPERAVEHWRRVCELDTRNVMAIYSLRELLKSLERYAEALPFYGKEHALVSDAERRLALLQDEADVRRLVGDLSGVTDALRQARAFASDDPAVTYQFGVSVVARVDVGEQVPPAECNEAAQALLGLAEQYDGEHGMMYAAAALKLAPGDDRAMQLADHYASALGRTAELLEPYRQYLAATPSGYMAEQAKAVLAEHGEPAAEARPSGYPPPAARPSGYPPVGAPIAGAPPGAAVATAPSDPPPAEPAAAPVDVARLLEEAAADAQRGRRPQAYETYRQVLAAEPANTEALSWVEEFLRQRRKFGDLRDVLLAASRVASVSAETRKAQLRDVAGLCGSKLRDHDTAIAAWKQICQIDREDTKARETLIKLLEKHGRWDELAPLMEQEAMNETDAEAKISLEKKVAALHRDKRNDAAAAAEAWVRIAEVVPGNEVAVHTAVDLYEGVGQLDTAAGVIVDNLGDINEQELKGKLLERLGDLRQKLGDVGGAGDAYTEAAELTEQDRLWERAIEAYRNAERWSDAAHCTEQQAALHEGTRKAELMHQAGQLLEQGGNHAAALLQFEQAAEQDPPNEEYAERVEQAYAAAGRQADQVAFVLRRAEQLEDPTVRMAQRHKAAALQWDLGDDEGACESLRQVLADGEDRAALEALLGAAQQREDHQEAVELLQRLVAVGEGEEKLGFALVEAQTIAHGIGDIDLAVERYEAVLKNIDPQCREALDAIAELELQRGNSVQAADALERALGLAEDEERIPLARRLGELYSGPLDDPRAAVRVLNVVHEADPEDFDAVARLQRLSEMLEDWPRVTEMLAKLIEVEGDPEEASEMSRQLATIFFERLGQGDQALAALEQMSDQGDVACQQAYEELGLELGWHGIVATKLVQWHESVAGTSRAEALQKAFHLFIEVGREDDARTVGVELARTRDADQEIAEKLEEIAVRLQDLDSLAVAHDILVADRSGLERAEELVRQAELLHQAGADPADAVKHGESGLASVEPADADVLAPRLAALAGDPEAVIELYQRQVARCRLPSERIAALARAAQVAAEHGASDRAREFFNTALSGGVHEEALAALETAARDADQGGSGDKTLLRTLAEALATGGQGSRDGGRTRGALLRRAAVLAHRDLGDVDRAFDWLADSIVTHVDDHALDALEDLGHHVNDMKRVEGALSRALEEVFDGPLVRKLLRRRADVRRDVLGDRRGAADDLKRLHDLSPSDQDLTEELSEILTVLEDHRGMIELYEDQILRGRDPQVRADLARMVARIWEEELTDAREAADAWRRVLRMQPGDPEATAGLERAKSGKLEGPPPVPQDVGSTSAGSTPPPDAAPAPEPVAEPVAPPPEPAVAAPAEGEPWQDQQWHEPSSAEAAVTGYDEVGSVPPQTAVPSEPAPMVPSEPAPAPMVPSEPAPAPPPMVPSEPAPPPMVPSEPAPPGSVPPEPASPPEELGHFDPQGPVAGQAQADDDAVVELGEAEIDLDDLDEVDAVELMEGDEVIPPTEPESDGGASR